MLKTVLKKNWQKRVAWDAGSQKDAKEPFSIREGGKWPEKKELKTRGSPTDNKERPGSRATAVRMQVTKTSL